MELARDPSDKNITNWISYNNKKNELNQRLQKRMREYLQSRSKLTPEVNRILKEKTVSTQTQFDPSRYKIRMYFDSKCPHCKRMFSTLDGLKDKGIYVEALQTDDAQIKKLSYPIPIRKASREEIKKHNIKSVPFTLIADLKKKVLYPPVQGFQDVSTMVTLLNEGDK